MNFSLLLLEFLKKQGSVSVPGFGDFYLKNANAVVDEVEKSILPPGKEVAFRTDATREGSEFIQFLAQQKNGSEIDAENEIKKQVNFWNSTLEKEGKLAVDHLGTFFLDDSKLHFRGLRTENLSPDFYGLEEITIAEIKNTKLTAASHKNSYRLSKSVYWLIPLLLGIATLTYFGITQPESIFGKKSFEDALAEKPVPEIKKDTLKVDSATIKNPVLDSLREDSIKNAAIPPVKKWSSKKYSKSKWKKPRKPQNR